MCAKFLTTEKLTDYEVVAQKVCWVTASTQSSTDLRYSAAEIFSSRHGAMISSLRMTISISPIDNFVESCSFLLKSQPGYVLDQLSFVLFIRWQCKNGRLQR
jgi:hypothetical protein